MFYSTLNRGDTKTLLALVSKVNASKDAEAKREASRVYRDSDNIRGTYGQTLYYF